MAVHLVRPDVEGLQINPSLDTQSNLMLCEQYFLECQSRREEDILDGRTVEELLARLHFLDRRVKRLPLPLDRPELNLKLDILKERITELLSVVRRDVMSRLGANSRVPSPVASVPAVPPQAPEPTIEDDFDCPDLQPIRTKEFDPYRKSNPPLPSTPKVHYRNPIEIPEVHDPHDWSYFDDTEPEYRRPQPEKLSLTRVELGALINEAVKANSIPDYRPLKPATVIQDRTLFNFSKVDDDKTQSKRPIVDFSKPPPEVTFVREAIDELERPHTGHPGRPVPQSSSTVKRFPSFAHSPRTSASQNGHKKIAIWKWNVTFSGEPHSTPVIEFLRQVHDKSASRGASKIELFDSACAFFTGVALKWFRAGSSNQLFSTWDELSTQLLSDFESYDYCENLLEYIKSRLQGPYERIVSYFASMEDLFIKLNQPIPEEQKVRIIRRNLRPEFLKALSLTNIQTILELRNYCKILEADFRRAYSRKLNSQPKEPEPFPKHVKFPTTTHLDSMNFPGSFYEKDNSFYELNESDERFSRSHWFEERSRPRERSNHPSQSYHSSSPHPHRYDPSPEFARTQTTGKSQ